MPLRSTHGATSGVMGSSRPASEAPTQSMGFASAASLSATHPGYASAAMSNAPGLDLADFPALGSQAPQSSSTNSSNASGMFSTYASHAGTGASSSPMMMSRGGAPFSQEDFPTLHRAHAAAAVAAQDSRNTHASMSYGPEQAAASWQQDPQSGASLAGSSKEGTARPISGEPKCCLRGHDRSTKRCAISRYVDAVVRLAAPIQSDKSRTYAS